MRSAKKSLATLLRQASPLREGLTELASTSGLRSLSTSGDLKAAVAEKIPQEQVGQAARGPPHGPDSLGAQP